MHLMRELTLFGEYVLVLNDHVRPHGRRVAQ